MSDIATGLDIIDRLNAERNARIADRMPGKPNASGHRFQGFARMVDLPGLRQRQTRLHPVS